MSRELNAYASTISTIGCVIALVSLIAAVASGVGTRHEIWNFRTGLTVLKWSAYGGLVATAISIAGVILSLKSGSGLLPPLTGLVLGAVLVALPAYWLEQSRVLPPIHDITTDTINPPRFVFILPLRKNASNPSDYGGPQIALQQKRAYPDIATLALAIPPDASFDRAVSAAQKLGWRIIDTGREDGRIEAVDTTLWFGFKDDIVIRIKGGDSESRIDVRSVSRVGISDLGTNAARIRKFLREMGKK